MAGADVPTKKIPDDREVPAGWKEAHSKGKTCFYWSAKGSSSYRADCVLCSHQFNGINVVRLKKKLRVGEREDYWVCGGTCWGNYLAMDYWEKCGCGICKSWCQYIEKLKEPGHQRSPFDGPTDGAIALASQDSASAAPMYIANQGVESGRAGLGSPRTLMEIMQQNTELLKQQENLRGQQDMLKMMLEEQQQVLVQQQAILQGEGGLNEHVMSLLAYCKKIVTKINTIQSVHSATNTSMTADSATTTETDMTPLIDGGWTATRGG